MRLMNPKSLENLKLQKTRKDGRGYRYTVSQEVIDILFTKLVEGFSLKKAAQEAGIHFVTARKYFENGDERRGIQPLRRRLLIFQERINEKFDTLLLERRQKLIDMVVKAITKIEEQIEAGIIMKKPNLAELERLIRLELYLRSANVKQESRSLLVAEDIRALAGADSGRGVSKESDS